MEDAHIVITLGKYTDLNCALWDCDRRKKSASAYCSTRHQKAADLESDNLHPHCLGNRFNLHTINDFLLPKLIKRMVKGVVTEIPVLLDDASVFGVYPWEQHDRFNINNMDTRKQHIS